MSAAPGGHTTVVITHKMQQKNRKKHTGKNATKTYLHLFVSISLSRLSKNTVATLWVHIICQSTNIDYKKQHGEYDAHT